MAVEVGGCVARASWRVGSHSSVRLQVEGSTCLLQVLL